MEYRSGERYTMMAPKAPSRARVTRQWRNKDGMRQVFTHKRAWLLAGERLILEVLENLISVLIVFHKHHGQQMVQREG